MTIEQENLITDNINLVYYMYEKSFKQYDAQGALKDDLIGEGMIGLVNAAIRFDITKGYAFSTFAAKCIQNNMGMYIRAYVLKGPKTTSLDAPIKDVKDSSIPLTLGDTIEGPEEFDINDIETIKAFPINDRDKEILTLKYMGYTQKEIANKLGCSRAYINAILHSIHPLISDLLSEAGEGKSNYKPKYKHTNKNTK